MTMQHVKEKRFGHGIFSQVNTFIAIFIFIDFVLGVCVFLHGQFWIHTFFLLM